MAQKKLADYYAELRTKLRYQRGPFLYRGQEDADWPLRSSAARRIYNSKIISDNEPIDLEFLIKYHERDLLEPAKLKGLHREAGGYELKDLELLAKLQHYGAATCLLDFSARFDIALWFACRDVIDRKANERKKGKVFVVGGGGSLGLKQEEVTPKELNSTIDKIMSFETRPQEIIDTASRLWRWRPESFLMGRMLGQESWFLFGPREIPKSGTFCVEIAKGDKVNLIKELEQRQGLISETVFPDIHGFALTNSSEKPLPRKSHKFYRGMAKGQFGAQ